MLVHNVYFSLADNSEAAQDSLVAACHEYLTGHPGMTSFFAGRRMVELAREVNDVEFDVCLSISFVDQAAHDLYQVAPRHFEFIEKNKSNWKHVRVFDSHGS